MQGVREAHAVLVRVVTYVALVQPQGRIMAALYEPSVSLFQRLNNSDIPSAKHGYSCLHSMSHPPAVPGSKVDVTVILHGVPSGMLIDGALVICGIGEELFDAVGEGVGEESGVTQ